MVFCSKCGKAIKKDDLFCKKCGNKIINEQPIIFNNSDNNIKKKETIIPDTNSKNEDFKIVYIYLIHAIFLVSSLCYIFLHPVAYAGSSVPDYKMQDLLILLTYLLSVFSIGFIIYLFIKKEYASLYLPILNILNSLLFFYYSSVSYGGLLSYNLLFMNFLLFAIPIIIIYISIYLIKK